METNITIKKTITRESVDEALKILVDNGIDFGEAPTVLQAVAYALIDTEIDELIDWE